MGWGAAGRVGVPHHLVRQLGVACLGQSELQDGRPVTQQLVRLQCTSRPLSKQAHWSSAIVRQCILLRQHPANDVWRLCTGGLQCWHLVRAGTTTTTVSMQSVLKEQLCQKCHVHVQVCSIIRAYMWFVCKYAACLCAAFEYSARHGFESGQVRQDNNLRAI